MYTMVCNQQKRNLPYHDAQVILLWSCSSHHIRNTMYFVVEERQYTLHCQTSYYFLQVGPSVLLLALLHGFLLIR